MQLRQTRIHAIPSINASANAAQARRHMSKYGIEATPVCRDGGSVVGIVTRRGLLPPAAAAEDRLQPQPLVTIDYEAGVADALALMDRQATDWLVVVRHGFLEGLVWREDLREYEGIPLKAAPATAAVAAAV